MRSNDFENTSSEPFENTIKRVDSHRGQLRQQGAQRGGGGRQRRRRPVQPQPPLHPHLLRPRQAGVRHVERPEDSPHLALRPDHTRLTECRGRDRGQTPLLPPSAWRCCRDCCLARLPDCLSLTGGCGRRLQSHIEHTAAFLPADAGVAEAAMTMRRICPRGARLASIARHQSRTPRRPTAAAIFQVSAAA